MMQRIYILNSDMIISGGICKGQGDDNRGLCSKFMTFFSSHIFRVDFGQDLDISKSMSVFCLISMSFTLVSVASSAQDMLEIMECRDE